MTCELVLSKFGSVCKIYERWFKFGLIGEPWTEHAWTRSVGPVRVRTRFERRTCPKINKNNKYISSARCSYVQLGHDVTGQQPSEMLPCWHE